MTTTHDVLATAVPRPETARPLENVLFSAALVARGLPWADLPARTLGLDALTRAGLGSRLMTHLQDRRDGRPVRLRTPFGTFLVPLTRADAEGLLARADRAGALGTASGLTTDGRRCGLSAHVVPSGAWDALTQEELAGLTARVDGHLQAVLDARREDGALDGHHWHAGDAAAEPTRRTGCPRGRGHPAERDGQGRDGRRGKPCVRGAGGGPAAAPRPVSRRP